MKQFIKKLLALVLILTSCSKTTNPPEQIGPLPSERQLAWHELEYYGLLHFNMSTYINTEWALGSENPEIFNPTELDTRQWAKAAKDAGMKGLILTVKHHDGFCLWPSKYTEHTVKKSPWRDGKGDLVKELSDACKEYGLKMGVYLSPWDRNHADYGTPKYVTYFHNQLEELLTNYGDIFEVWFDGANGGSGYYGGANETRKIDRKVYYQFKRVEAIVRKLQPNAVIFSDNGPDVRWVGNENGWANETNWCVLRRAEVYPGWPRYPELRSGHEDGTHWVPAEADVSIRPSWYYRAAEDHLVHSLPKLLNIYYQSIGRNSNLAISIPVDRRGLVHEKDVEKLKLLHEQLDKDFKTNLAHGKTITATNERGYGYEASKINDGNKDTYWATEDNVIKSSFTIDLVKPTEINRILLQEYIPLGQRIQEFSVEAEVKGQWILVNNQTTIGYKRILRLKRNITATKIRINILKAKGSPTISNFELYNAPLLLVPPKMRRKKNGAVNFTPVNNTPIRIYYTLDGSEPNKESTEYTNPFLVEQPTTLKYIAYGANSQTKVVEHNFEVSKKDWKVIDVSSGNLKSATQAIDDDPWSVWATSDRETTKPQHMSIDLGKTYTLKGFIYQPTQRRLPFGVITNYEFYISMDGHKWKKVLEGEFDSIVDNPVEKRIPLKSVKARYIRLKGTKVKGNNFRATFGEIGIITK